MFLANGRTATAVAEQWHTMTFRADAPGVDENPLRGFVPYSSTRQTGDSFPHSMEWFYLPLADVVTGPDTYDWSAVEQQLAAIAGREHQAIFRFYVDYPKKPTGIPAYLLAAGLKTFPYDDSDNARSTTPSVSPDYRDPRLIECMVRFIHAFGARYDGDVRIAYLAAGLYGFWGEWHVHNHPFAGESAGWSIETKDKDALLRAYVESFQRTPVLVRYPKATEDRRLLAHFGFHDDSFLKDTIGREGWQFWPSMERAGTARIWQWHPMGGEIYPALHGGLWDSWPNAEGQDVTAAIATTHATWLLDAALFKAVPTAEERANVLRAERMLGYTLFCEQWRMIRNKDRSATLTVRMENRGVAPMYYAWPIEAEALDGDGKAVGQGNAVWPLPSLLPGKAAEWSISLREAPNSTKTVVLRIANPMTGGHAVAFANAEMATVLPGWLTLNLEGER
jgi:hypothetical protein